VGPEAQARPFAFGIEPPGALRAATEPGLAGAGIEEGAADVALEEALQVEQEGRTGSCTAGVAGRDGVMEERAHLQQRLIRCRQRAFRLLPQLRRDRDERHSLEAGENLAQ